MRNSTKCRKGHVFTSENTYVRKKGKYDTRECRECMVWRKSPRSKYMATQKVLSTATIEREDMAECWNCLPSPVTGKRGRVGIDRYDPEFIICLDCGRGPRVTIVLGGVG